MIRLSEINEINWTEAVRLSVTEEQKRYLDTAVGILARGYAYRDKRARVFGITEEKRLVGLVLVKDLDEEPACYDLQQFLIDRRYQGRGFGSRALELLLAKLRAEGKYPVAEVCVKQENTAALRLFERAGFTDTGYVDEDVPDCVNLMLGLRQRAEAYTDRLIGDFSDPAFQQAFRLYFAEMGVPVRDWDGLFRQMNEEGGNRAWLRTSADGKTIGFLQFKPIAFTSCFFEESCGFIREFWVAEGFRNRGHGAALLRLTEESFRRDGLFTAILTTDSAEKFYLRRGYERAPGCKAKNEDVVFVKRL